MPAIFFTPYIAKLLDMIYNGGKKREIIIIYHATLCCCWSAREAFLVCGTILYFMVWTCAFVNASTILFFFIQRTHSINSNSKHMKLMQYLSPSPCFSFFHFHSSPLRLSFVFYIFIYVFFLVHRNLCISMVISITWPCIRLLVLCVLL